MKKPEAVPHGVKPKTRAEAMLEETRETAAAEIAAYRQAVANVKDIKALLEQYRKDAEDLQTQIDSEPSLGLSAKEIVTYMASKNVLRDKLSEAEEAVKLVENRFIPEAYEHLKATKEALRASFEAVVGRYYKAEMGAINEMIGQIKTKMVAWDSDIATVRSEPDLQGFSISTRFLSIEVDTDSLTYHTRQVLSAQARAANAGNPARIGS